MRTVHCPVNEIQTADDEVEQLGQTHAFKRFAKGQAEMTVK